jgi:protease-4
MLAAELTGIEGEPRVVEPRKRFSIRDLIEGRLLGVLPRLTFEAGVSLKYLMAF